jgi:chromosome segregation protein
MTKKVQEFTQQRQVIKERIAKIDSEKKEFMSKYNAYNQAKATIESDISKAYQEEQKANSELLITEKRISHIQSRLPEIEMQINEIQQKQKDIREESTKQKEELEKTKQIQNEFDNKIKNLDSERGDILKQQSEITKKKIEGDKKIKILYEKLNSAKIEFAKTKSNKQDIDDKIALNTNKKSNFEIGIAKLYSVQEKLQSLKTNHQSTINELKSRIIRLDSKKERIERDVDELETILAKSTKAASQYETKIKVVKSIMHEDYSIAKLKQDAQELGIKGLVYEMITWDKKYERAVLAAGSDWIKAIVVNDFTTLVSLAEYARFKKLPKLKIIPYEIIAKFKLDTTNRHQEKGVIGILSDYVKCDPKYLALKTFLFGNVILTESRETANKISKAGYKTVTIHGEFFEAKTSAVIVDNNSKISRLTKIISMSGSVEGLLQSISLLKRYIQKRKNMLKKAQKSIAKHKERLAISETGLATSNQSYNDLKDKIEYTEKLHKTLQDRVDELLHKKERFSKDLIRNESYITSLDERVRLVEENYTEGEQQRIADEISRLNEKKSQLESERSQIMEQFQKQSSSMASLSSDELREENNIQNLQKEQLGLKAESQNLEPKVIELRELKNTNNDKIVELREEQNKLISSTFGSSVPQLEEYDTSLKDLNKSERYLTNEINSLERKLDAFARDLDSLNENRTRLQQTLDAFGFTKKQDIETYDVEPLLVALQTEQRNLTDSLNAKAPETYIQASEGYRSMSTRKNSLEQERNSIVRFIEDVEKDKRETFLNAFDSVDKEIRSIFEQMTGGNAWLELQNEDDIFNSGISYLIQFPNKPKRESTSISGGEKTLAAIVFVLALQKLKPSPFYLFDEVDAHLDTPNSERLSKILEERAKTSQFIMVSLKDLVVKKAGLIYGVYPKKGVSHVITYKDKRLPSMSAQSTVSSSASSESSS